MPKKRTAKQSQPSPVGSYDEDKWRVESAYGDLQRAEKHKRDSGLMRKVRSHANDQAKAALRIAKLEKRNPRV